MEYALVPHAEPPRHGRYRQYRYVVKQCSAQIPARTWSTTAHRVATFYWFPNIQLDMQFDTSFATATGSSRGVGREITELGQTEAHTVVEGCVESIGLEPACDTGMAQ